MNKIFSLGLSVLLVADGIKVGLNIINFAELYSVPVLSTEKSTEDIVYELKSFLNYNFAPKITRSGELLNINGVGVLLTGESGIGKSETALELIKRRHKIISDDTVEIKKISENVLEGFCCKHENYMEIKGLGLIDIKKVFGLMAIENSKKIDIVINLKKWENYEIKLGNELEYTKILGIKLPLYNLPVRSGNNLANIIELTVLHSQKSICDDYYFMYTKV